MRGEPEDIVRLVERQHEHPNGVRDVPSRPRVEPSPEPREADDDSAR